MYHTLVFTSDITFNIRLGDIVQGAAILAVPNKEASDVGYSPDETLGQWYILYM